MRKACQVNNKGQITLPKSIREVFNIKEYEKVELSLDVNEKKIFVERKENEDKELFELIDYMIESNPGLVILVEGKSGVGKTYLSKLMVQAYMDKVKQGHKNKEVFDLLKNFYKDDYISVKNESLSFEDEAYHSNLIESLHDKLTIITNQEPIDIQRDNLLRNSKRPIVVIKFSTNVRGQVAKVLFYPSSDDSHYIVLKDTPVNISYKGEL